jgi:pyridoxal phosphate enzyme (YggS family)
MSITQQLQQIRQTLPSHVTLVAVSKTKPISALQEAYDAGQRIFGENKVQELAQKAEQMPGDIEWHMIGHLQSNKIKYIVSFVALIHGVDSIKLLEAINKEGMKIKRVIPCLLQIHIASEETKFGFSPDEITSLLESYPIHQLEFVDIRGLMGMATFSDDESLVANEFAQLKQLFDLLGKTTFSGKSSFSVLSMGMSDDYQLAIAQGSNMVRVGSNIFGERDYTTKI